ncbi:hypothetical protein [Psychrobacter frigidicola]|uniref:hypothetical protein n=1 Tax=Psychrobacter frigidicola TaxID=45611 RepID=UPI001917DB5E|nr:hypothetical protein [Psychrobacter frigidicola]
MKLKLPLLIVSLFFLVACSPSDDTANVQSIQEPSATNDVVPEVEATAPKAELTPIPMSDSHENGRYFLTSHTTENGVENVEYIRKGNESDAYVKTQIKCSSNKVKKYSADNPAALISADMGDWVTVDPDWTDADSVKFICK